MPFRKADCIADIIYALGVDDRDQARLHRALRLMPEDEVILLHTSLKAKILAFEDELARLHESDYPTY